jgi:hypothetical protein
VPRGERTVELKPPLAGNELHPVDAGVEVAPRSRQPSTTANVAELDRFFVTNGSSSAFSGSC